MLKVGTIRDNEFGFRRLFKLLDEVNECSGEDVHIDFSRCTFLPQNAVAFLGGLAAILQERGCTVVFRWDTLRDEIRTNLARNGFLQMHGIDEYLPQGNSIPFRRDMGAERKDVMRYLLNEWIGNGWMQVSTDLAYAIAGTVWEIYENAFEHGRSGVGVVTCGQRYPHRKELALTTVDFGIGVVDNVRTYLDVATMPAGEALEWAFRAGTTTRACAGMSRGLGLDILRSFVRSNNGRIQVFSNDGYGVISSTRETFEPLPTPFKGTAINITLKCDESMYVLASELDDEPLF